MLLATAYFPPVEYFAAIAEGMRLSNDGIVPSVVYIEACENYQKQSWRNRCRIYTESGAQDLRVPVIHEGGTHSLPIHEIKIDWSTPWLVQSERAISSAYESSAFFDYYKDDLFDILNSKPETLFEFNLNIIRFFLSKTGISADIRLTENYTGRNSGVYGQDLREVIHPKRANSILEDLDLKKPYFQVFAPKHGFIPNLSIMDLLFNEGPESINYLFKI